MLVVTLRPRSIGTWDEMTHEFFKKYFPEHKIDALKRQISIFSKTKNKKIKNK